MSKWDSLRLGAQAMTKKDYYENRGDQNGKPVMWQSQHMHRHVQDRVQNDLWDGKS